jgi:hypothetical protein
MKIDLQKIAFSIFELCVKCFIFLGVAWIPRSLSIEADLHNKVFDFDDWEVSEWVFKLFDKKWRSHTLTVTIIEPEHQLVQCAWSKVNLFIPTYSIKNRLV